MNVVWFAGKDMVVFMDQWVRMGGHAKFSLKFIFNRKRNTVELEINQGHNGDSCLMLILVKMLHIYMDEVTLNGVARVKHR